MTEAKRRKLRLSDGPTASSLQFNFENINKLLFLHEPLQVKAVPEDWGKPYRYFHSAIEIPPVTKKQVTITSHDTILPRRNRVRSDPLPDELYLPFHRRMKKDEKSVTTSERDRIYFEMDNLRAQLQHLKGNEWQRYLPVTTVITNKVDQEELHRKRELTILELERILARLAGWEGRCNKLASDLKRFEKKQGQFLDSDCSDDESILSESFLKIRAAKSRKRLYEYGAPCRILLRNGYSISFNPYRDPAAAIVPESLRL